MRAVINFAAIASLAFNAFATDLHANERVSNNPLRRAWDAAARTYGICYGPGYHACPNCKGKCRCGQSGGPMLYGPVNTFSSPNYTYADTMGEATPHHGGSHQVQEPTLAVPEPVYVAPTEVGIPEKYNQPELKPQRTFTPKKQQQRSAPEPVLRPEAESKMTSDPEDLPATADPLPQLSAPKRGSEDSLPLPKLPSQPRSEPNSPSDQSIELPEFEPQLSLPPRPAPSRAVEPMVPAVPPRAVEPPEPNGAQAPSMTRPVPAAPTPPSQPAGKSPFESNQDDLLVPPDTHLLDSVQFRRTYPQQRGYRTATRPRAVITEPR